MAINFVQVNNAEDQLAAGTIAATFLSSPHSGNLVVAGVYAQAASPVTSVIDDMGNTYHKAVSQSLNSVDLGNATIEIWYAWNITVAGTHTVTFSSGAGHNTGIVIQEFSGVKKTADPIDGVGSAANQNTPPTMQCSVTVTGTSNMLFGWGIAESFRGSTLTKGAAFTEIFNNQIDASTGWDSETEYQILSSSGVKTTDWDNTAGDLAWIATSASFLAAPVTSLGGTVIGFGF